MTANRNAFFVLLTLGACAPRGNAPTSVPSPAPIVYGVIPLPTSMRLDATQTFRVDTTVVISVDARADSATLGVAGYVRAMLAPLIRRDVERGASTAGKSITLSIDTAGVPRGIESYALDISAQSVSITARSAAGLFYGVQTFRQLLPVSVEHPAALGRKLVVPTGHITDAPRYEWRGISLDVSRHFLPPRDVKRFVDLLALYKMNRLHIHLADDQGWRIEIKSRPNLALIGGSTQVGGGAGGYYTQDEYRDLVQYAASRFITVVPEIDMPAHINAALASYPELTCDHVAPPLYTGIAVGFSALCVDSAAIYPVIEDIVREISAITPGAYYHMGGDEVQKLNRAQYIAFIERMQEIVSRNGKRMVGWADISTANLSPSTIVQHWAKDSAQLQVARGGKVIMSPGPKAYLDMKYDSTTILGLQWAGFVTQRAAYDWDPGNLRPEIPDNAVLGVEAPLWAETVVRAEDYEFLLFPRLLSIAEVGWTKQDLRRWEEFDGRLGVAKKRLTALGVNAGH